MAVLNPGTLYLSSSKRGTTFHDTELKYVCLCVLGNKNIISYYHKSHGIASLLLSVFS